MLCENCKKKEAVIHYTEVVDGQMKKIDLCEQCSIEKGIGHNSSFSIGDFVGGITDPFVSEHGVHCSSCGMSLEEFRAGGRLGCSVCYESFYDYLIKMIEQIHRSVTHKGKVPKRSVIKQSKKEDSKKLEQELKEAIKVEDFEKAAFLRDEIKMIKAKLK